MVCTGAPLLMPFNFLSILIADSDECALQLNRLSTSELKRQPSRSTSLVPSTQQHVHNAVKCTLVQALRFCTGRTAHTESTGIALFFHDHGTIRGWGVSVTPRPLFTPRKNPVPIVQEAGWAPGPVWTGAENLAPTGIRTPDRPARSQSVHNAVLISILHVLYRQGPSNRAYECHYLISLQKLVHL